MMENETMPLYSQDYSDRKMVPKPMIMPTVSQPMAAPMGPILLQPQPLLLGPENTVTTCPFCSASIKTAVKFSTTTGTHIAAAHWAAICCCCCLPYSMDSAKNADHYCPNCQRYLGTYRR